MTAPAGTSSDPFSLVEDAIWFGLESYAPLAALVKIGNRVKLTGVRDNAIKETVGQGDLPELQVWKSGAQAEPGSVPRTSDTYFWEQQYSIGITTTHLRTNLPSSINPIQWYVIRALARAERTIVKPALPFVTWFKPGQWTDQLQDASMATGGDRGAMGWKSIYLVRVQFQWSFAELLA